MSAVHEILSKLSLEGDHSTFPSAYRSVQEHTNLDQPESDPLNTEMTIKTKGVDEEGRKEGRKEKERKERNGR
uniref:Uncharacterized protein n=1 Tax=Panthera leo TaxID=9689 RepID=A0A8C8XEL7_PANLE